MPPPLRACRPRLTASQGGVVKINSSPLKPTTISRFDFPRPGFLYPGFREVANAVVALSSNSTSIRAPSLKETEAINLA